jgi:hypothetical protein
MSTGTLQLIFSSHHKMQEYKLTKAEWKRYSYKNLQISFLKLDNVLREIVIVFYEILDDD